MMNVCDCANIMEVVVVGKLAGEMPIIYIVEDNDLLREALVDVLRENNYLTDDFEGGDDCFAAVHRKRPNIILSDIEMPNGDGFSLIDRINAAGLNIPVILMSGISKPGIEALCLSRGACAYMQKPFEIEQLRDALTGALSRSRDV